MGLRDRLTMISTVEQTQGAEWPPPVDMIDLTIVRTGDNSLHSPPNCSILFIRGTRASPLAGQHLLPIPSHPVQSNLD